MSEVVTVAAAALTDKKTWKALAVLASLCLVPLFLILAVILSMASSAAEHNRATVIASFDPSITIPDSVPAEFSNHIAAMRQCFAAIDRAVAELEIPEDAPELDITLIKAIYFGLFNEQDTPTLNDDSALTFVECFITYEERVREEETDSDESAEDNTEESDEDAEEDESPETYQAAIPITDMPTVFQNVAQHLHRSITGETQSACMEVYYIIKYGDASRANQADALLAALVDGDTEYIGGTAGSPFSFDWHDRVTSEFGGRRDPITGQWDGHTGLDLSAPYGTPIRAVAAGKVILARYGHPSYGNYIVLDHGGGVVTLYAHCSELTAYVGQQVNAGDQIAKVGSTGRATGNHLHIEVQVNGERKNPRTFLQ